MEEIIINRDYTSIVTSGEGLRTTDCEKYFTPYKRRKLISTASFQRKLNSVLNLNSNILPNNVRFVQDLNGGDKLVVVEEPPCVRSIHVEFDMAPTIEKLKTTGKLEEYGYENWLENNKSPYRFHLSFPYIVYILHITRELDVLTTKVYYRMHPITSFSDYLFLTNLLNVDSQQSMCLGDGQENTKNTGNRTFADSINCTLERFWLNSFNKDYIYNYQDYQYIPNVCDFLTWEYHTKKDPMFIYNVEWIPFDLKLGNIINSFIDRNVERNQGINFETIFDIFSKPVIAQPTGDNQCPKTIWNNVVDSMIIKDSTIAVGDMIEIDKKEYYINAFNGTKTLGSCSLITSIEVEDEDNNVMTVKLTSDLRASLEKQIYNSKFLRSTEVNGETITIGDILILSYPNKSYKKVSKIRRARDGVIEIQFNQNDYYLMKKILFEKFDVNNIVINGVKLEKNKTYFIGTDEYSNHPLITSKMGKFIQIKDSSSGKLFLEFKIASGDYFHMPLPLSSLNNELYDKYKIFEFDNVEKPKVFRLFNFLVTTTDFTHGIVKGCGILSSGNAGDLEYSCDHAKQEIISENSINITSCDIDINLSVGEQVVIADWVNPTEMLKVRTIESFTVGEDNRLFVNTVFKDQKRSDTYIDFQNGTIEMGKIRKVVTKFGSLQSGDKIRAEIPRLANFPKKDVNTIVAFLVDTGTKYPLMLCSNCCTLWAAPEVLEQFIVYGRGTRDWGRYQNAPIELNKIKIQSGDVVRIDDVSFLVYYSDISNSNKLLITDLIDSKKHLGYPLRTSIGDNEINRVGIITPRYSAKQQTELTLMYKKRCFPNLHGGYMEHFSSGLMFKEVWDHV